MWVLSAGLLGKEGGRGEGSVLEFKVVFSAEYALGVAVANFVVGDGLEASAGPPSALEPAHVFTEGGGVVGRWCVRFGLRMNEEEEGMMVWGLCVLKIRWGEEVEDIMKWCY